MFSLFTEPAAARFGAQATAILVMMLLVLNVTTHFVWIGAGVAITRLIRSHQAQKAQGLLFCLSLLAVALWLFIDNPFWKTL